MARLTQSTTYLWQLKPTKDGQPWDLSGATVTLYLRDGEGSATPFAASIIAGSPAYAQYTGQTTDLPASGDWSAVWHAVQGSDDVWFEPVPLTVIGR